MKVLFCVDSLLSQTSICWLKWISAGFSVVGRIGCWDRVYVWISQWDWIEWPLAGHATASLQPATTLHITIYDHLIICVALAAGTGPSGRGWLWFGSVLEGIWHPTEGLKCEKLGGRRLNTRWKIFLSVSNVFTFSHCRLCDLWWMFPVLRCSTSSFECPEKRKEFWILKTWLHAGQSNSPFLIILYFLV